MSDELVSLGTAEKYCARAEAAESALASLRAAITELADEWECKGDYPDGHREACMWCHGAADLRALAAHPTKEGNER